MTYLSFVSMLLFMLVHLMIGRVHFLQETRWRSVGAGVAMSYVFLDVLPHLSAKQIVLQETVNAGFGAFFSHHVYLLALAGFVVYFGLAGTAREARIGSSIKTGSSSITSALYLLMLSLGAYCFLIGFLIGEQPDHRFEPTIIFALAMAIHMAGVDHLVRELYPQFYDRMVRWLLAGTTFAGWAIGAVTTITDLFFALVFSFVVGAILIVAFVYELPFVTERQRYWLFVAGALGFSALLLIYEALSGIDLSA